MLTFLNLATNSMLEQTHYIKSAFALKQLPQDTGHEIALVGRSNAGKSSFLNTITGQKGLARISKTPGRTQAMNVFSIAENKRIIDLPGYGYAKVPEAMRLKWGKMLDAYFKYRESLCGMVLIMDCRHPLKESDKEMIEYANIQKIPMHFVLTKADKLTYANKNQRL